MAKQLSALTRKAMKCPALTADEQKWIGDYESETGFEAMHLDEVIKGEMSFDKMADENVLWFENWMTDTHLRISNVPVRELA